MSLSYGIITVRITKRLYARQTSAFPFDPHGSHCEAFSRTEGRSRSDRILRQGHCASSNGEVRETSLCLPRQPKETSWPLLRVDIQGPRQDCKCTADSGKRANFSSRRQTIQEPQVHPDSHGKAISPRAIQVGQTSLTTRSCLTQEPGIFSYPGLSQRLPRHLIKLSD
jgi:hypothetical protein